MFITVLWLLVGGYFIYLGIEILFFKVTKRIGSLETHVYKNQKAFVFRLGLLELIFGILLVASSILAIIKYNQIWFSYKLIGIERQAGYGIIPIAVAIVAVISIWINQKASEANITKDTKKDKKDGE